MPYFISVCILKFYGKFHRLSNCNHDFNQVKSILIGILHYIIYIWVVLDIKRHWIMDYGMSSFTLNTCKGGFLQLLGISSELCIFILIILIKPFWSLVDHIRTRPKTNLELGVIIVQHSLYGCSAFGHSLFTNVPVSCVHYYIKL